MKPQMLKIMTNKKIKAVLIDVENKIVTDVEIEPTLDAYYNAIKCTMIEVAMHLPLNNILYVDEEGLFKDDKKYFIASGGHQPFAGNGLIVGSDENGGDIDTSLFAKAVTNAIEFI